MHTGGRRIWADRVQNHRKYLNVEVTTQVRVIDSLKIQLQGVDHL